VRRRAAPLVALAGVVGSFTLAALFWRRVILIHCSGSGPDSPEGTANCLQIHMTNLLPVCLLFAASALALLVTILRNDGSD
jgi:hypothetical protein